jgi:hypothetical protein
VLALAAGTFSLGTFTDPRVKAIMPLDGSAQVFYPSDAPAIFATIHVPTLLFSGPLSPVLHPLAQVVFETIPADPPVVAFADLRDAGHGTFTDVCELSDDLLAAFGGVPFECQPVALPWRYARHIIAYLGLNFFDATLNADPDAFAASRPRAWRRSRISPGRRNESGATAVPPELAHSVSARRIQPGMSRVRNCASAASRSGAARSRSPRIARRAYMSASS